MLSSLLHFSRTVLASRHLFWLLPSFVLLHLSFGVDVGWLIDDHGHRAALTHHPDSPDLHRSPAELFTFVDGDPDRLAKSVADGAWPWWSSPGLRLAFWRPIAGWSHALDYLAWPEKPSLMHFHSLSWFLILIVLLLALYRRLLPGTAIAGLAALIYALDDSQIFPVLWLANRNAVLAVLFGVGCLLAHDRWRRDGWVAGAFLAPLLLLLAVLSNEGAVAIGGYLIGYALFLDPAPLRGRLLALLPTTSLGACWALAYKIGGYGALGSGVYIDPASEPWRFASAFAQRGPFLLWGWWGFPPADATIIMPQTFKWAAWGIVVLLLVGGALLLRPILRREASARFLAFGMMLALVPACATFPSNRLLGFVGIGAAGLLALLLAELATKMKGNPWRQGCRRSLLVVLVMIHLLLAPLLARPYMGQMLNIEKLAQQTARSLVELVPSGTKADSTVVVVTAPSVFISLVARLIATLSHDHSPRTHLVLAASIHTVDVSRPDARTLELRPRGGFLQSPSDPSPITQKPEWDPTRSLLLLDLLFRDLHREPFAVGDRIRLQGARVEILEVDRGRPLAVAFRFDEPLEALSWHWLGWRQGQYVSFPLPKIGETLRWSSPNQT